MNRDYKFIAHARTDIPALIAEVRRLRADADQSRRTARDFQEQAKKAGDECDRLRTALAIADSAVYCENLHHAKKDQHKSGETCPVENRYRAILEE